MSNKKQLNPPKPFDVIYADPPWDIAQRGRFGASRHYDLLSTAEITAMDVGALAGPNATLLLWVTNAGLAAGLEVMKAWGFTYKTNLVWDKGTLGLGNYFRNGHEILLHGVRGRAPFVFHGQRSVVYFPRTTHSTKPAEMVPLIERLFPAGTRFLELFARDLPNSHADWSVWGLEAPKSDIAIPGYPVPSDFDQQEAA